MFEQFGRCRWRGRALTDYRFFVGGQVCVHRAYRGQRLMPRLYHEIRQIVRSDYDLCVTEIAARNVVSLRAHERMGFEAISTYADEQEEWVLVAWDLQGEPRHESGSRVED